MQILPVIKETAEQTMEISSASKEQADGITQINSALLQIDQSTQTNASAAQQLAATSHSMISKVTYLQEKIEFFKCG